MRWSRAARMPDRKSTRLNSSHSQNSYAVFCLKKKKIDKAGLWITKSNSLRRRGVRAEPRLRGKKCGKRGNVPFCFFFNDTATTEIYTLSLHDALPIFARSRPRNTPRVRRRGAGERSRERRSEEHTSELQSQSNLVCRLLLEKKKKKKEQHTTKKKKKKKV